MTEPRKSGDLPDVLPIAPRGPLDATVRVPGSKSITNRALLVAALANGDSELTGGLESDDTRVMRAALAALGCELDLQGEPSRDPTGPGDGVWRVRGTGGRLHAPSTPLWTENSGTTARFLTAAVALADGPVVIDGNPRMRERPIADLTGALTRLGVGVEILGEGGCPPVRIAGGGLPGGRAEIDASRSSQYVSAVLLAAPYAQRDVHLEFANGILVSRPYVDLTLAVMRDFGAQARFADSAPDSPSTEGAAVAGLSVTAGHPYRGRRYAIEPDASAAAYPLCAAAIAGGRVRVEGLPGDSIQADLGLLPILERMGCRTTRGTDFVELEAPPPPARLRAVDVDMNDLPDAALALAVVALFAEGETRIRNVWNLRIKETDRLAALEKELNKLGASARSSEDSLFIKPPAAGASGTRGAEIETYDDHRMAMAFALAGLRIPGVTIRDPSCTSKTWPEYFSVLEHL